MPSGAVPAAARDTGAPPYVAARPANGRPTPPRGTGGGRCAPVSRPRAPPPHPQRGVFIGCSQLGGEEDTGLGFQPARIPAVPRPPFPGSQLSSREIAALQLRGRPRRCLLAAKFLQLPGRRTPTGVGVGKARVATGLLLESEGQPGGYLHGKAAVATPWFWKAIFSLLCILGKMEMLVAAPGRVKRALGCLVSKLGR